LASNGTASDQAAERMTASVSIEGGGLLLAGLLIATLLYALIVLPPIEAALTSLGETALSEQLPNPTGGTATPPPAVSSGRQQATPTALPAGMSYLATDNFQRPDQRGWGTTSDGHSWQADARQGAIFAIRHQQGQLSNGQGAYNAILGPTFSDGEIFFTGAISSFQQANLGSVARWMDTNNWYKAYLDGSQLVLLKSSGGMQTRLAAVPFAAQANRFYNLRFRVQGDRLAARAWPVGTAEPSQWQVSARDETFQSGFGGLRLVVTSTTTITISAFQELALTASSPTSGSANSYPS
jgi:hypothetical protein